MDVIMAINHDKNESPERKISSLSDDSLTPLSRTIGGVGKRGREKQERVLPKKHRFSKRILIIDLVLLLLIGGIMIGGWYGFRALKEMYVPTYEEKLIEFCVEIRGIDYERVDALLADLEQSDLWYSQDTDGNYLGKITSADFRLVITDDGAETATVLLTVRTTALYRKGEGYYVDSLRILAGEKGVFRTKNMVAEGMFISVNQVEEGAK